MKVFELSEDILIKFGLFSRQLNQLSGEFLKSKTSWAYIFVVGIWILASLAQFMKKVGEGANISEYTFSLVQIFLVSGQLGAYIYAGLSTDNFNQLHEQLQQIVNNAYGTAVYELYEKSEKKSQKATRMAAIISTSFNVGLVVPTSLIHSAICMWHGNFDASTYFFEQDVYVPVDRSNIIWFYILVFCELIWLIAYNCMFATLLTYFVGCCSYIETCCEHFRILCRKIGENIDRNSKKAVKSMPTFNGDLRDAVFLHVEIFEMYNLISKIMNGIVFCFMVPSAISLGVELLRLDENLQNLNLVVFIDLFLIVVLLLTFPFILCYYATYLTHNLSSVGDVAYTEIGWADLAPNLRKCVMLVIQRSQVEAGITGFGIISCTLESFSKIVKSAWSYYLLIREQ